VRARAAYLVVVAAALAAPAVTQARTLELESGRTGGEVVRDRGAHGGRAVALSGRTALRRPFSTRSPVASVVLRARTGRCPGRTRLSAALDGRRLGSRLVRSRRYRLYRFATRARAGAHVLRLAIAGPRRGRSCRRRLLLDRLTLVVAAAPGAPTPTPPPGTPAPPALAAAPAPAPAPAPVPPAAPAAYQNPVFAAPGAPDPTVLDVGGAHSEYFAFSTGGRFPVLRSPDLVSWEAVGTAMTSRPDWAVPTGDYHPWAPSVIERQGPCPGETGTRCFILFYVSLHNNSLTPSTNCIGVATSQQPQGPYEDQGPLEHVDGTTDASGRPLGCGDDRGYSNIDPAPFVDSDGRAYLYLSTTHTCEPPPTACSNVRQIGVIGLTPDLLKASTARQTLFSADAGGWEQAPWAPVVENPWVVERGGRYFLLYSGGSYLGAYGMGYATSTSPTGPFSKATENPILRESPPVLSPGGGSLATGPRGGDWLVYHGREGTYDQPRQLRIDPVTFTGESTVSVAGPTSTPQPVGP
jgi:Glycosyl hydrolases family 43